MKFINAGMSDLGASAAKQDTNSGGSAAAVASSTSGLMSKACSCQVPPVYKHAS